LLVGFVAACGASEDPGTGDAPGTPPPAEVGDQPTDGIGAADTPPPPPDPGPGTVDCGGAGVIAVDVNATTLATATDTGEHTLVIEGASTSATSWAEKGNEALVLEITKKSDGKRIAHVVMHQGKDKFSYGMHVGALAAGDVLEVKVSPLSAPMADKKACLSTVTLKTDTSEAVQHAPVMVWPKQKVFDDLPVVVGWSKSGKSYQVTYTNENGGTVALCGGGATGIRSEIARWGRALDMETAYHYAAGPVFERCTGTAAPRMESDHPILYYGDGHNRLFESRGGYGQTCGTSGDAMADGKLEGWNDQNPGNEPDKDDPFTVVLRPLPVDLAGRPSRESLVDHDAPWLYAVTAAELARENKIDNAKTFGLDQYLYLDVYAADVGGNGDSTCGFVPATGGFVVRATTKGGKTFSAAQMTSDFMVGSPKRIAIPLPQAIAATDVTKITLDAYDGDGVYWLALGDAFIPRKSGTNGAVLDYAHKSRKTVNVYVDDNNGGCVNGKNTYNGVAYPCTGTLYTLDL